MKRTLNLRLVTCIVIFVLCFYAIQISATDFSVWDGKSYIEPVIKNGTLIIDSAANLAWVLKNQTLNGVSTIKINCNIDMSNFTFLPIPNSLVKLIGNNKTIQNLKINGSGMLGDKQNIDLSNLTLKNIYVKSQDDAGIIVGTLTGNSSFVNIKIQNSTVSTSKNAGGLIGVIRRNNETNRAEVVNVKVMNCSVNNLKIDGKQAEGKFIGLFYGYDKREIVILTKCSAIDTNINTSVSAYTKNNQACFNKHIKTSDDGFIGSTKYYRGLTSINGIVFNHKWDGITVIEPLLANPKYDGAVKSGNHCYVVYSPFDLAGIRNITDSPNAVYLKISVDMNGEGRDGIYNVPNVFSNKKQPSTDDNNFKPFKKIALLDGGNNVIYNLAICELEKTAGAFILSASGTTEHKNIKFDNCQTVSTHKVVNTNATAQGAILIASAGGSNYKMNNVTVRNCKVFALQKVGMLAGYLGATNSSIKNCVVSNCYIENYKCNISETFDSGTKTFKGRSIRVTADFFPQGEVGGLVGFVQNASSIDNCHVKNTKIYAYGQSDKMAKVAGSQLGQAALKAAGYYQVPGRHVSTFIGDIRTTKNVTILNCSVDSNTKCTNTWDKHNSSYDYIGRAYYVEFLDKNTGGVTVNNQQLTLEDCNKHTSR